MAIYYHGSSVLFSRFDLAHALEGTSKLKFGYGVYLTSSFRSAAHYSGANKNATTHYVYTVDVPDITEDNYIAFKQPVNETIIQRAEAELGMSIPSKAAADGKDFRKFLASYFEKQIDVDLRSDKNIVQALKKLIGEQEAAEFLMSIGVEYITWPYSWRNPQLGMNIAVFNDSKIKIVSIHQVELDAKQQLIAGSEKEVRL